MSYTRLTWVESETPLSAQNMNNIEDGIEELQAQKVDKTSGKGLSTNDYTTDEKTKLAGIEAGAEVNRTYTAVTGKPTADAAPAFGGTVTVSQVEQDADGQISVTDRVITIPNNDATTSTHGLMSATDKSKLNGIAAGAQVNRTYTAVTGKPTAAASPGFGGTVTVSQVTQSTTGQVSVTDRVITIPSSDATTSAHGLMTAADKTKLNGIAAGAQVNPGNATTSAAGLMSSADKTKLNGIEAGAEVNKSISSLVLTTNSNVTFEAGDFFQIAFVSEVTSNKPVVTGIREMKFINSSNGASKLLTGGYTLAVGAVTGGWKTTLTIALWNPMNGNVTLDASKSSITLAIYGD